MKHLEEKDLNCILKEVIREAKHIKIPISKNISHEVVINKRAKNRFGCCKMEKQGLKRRFTIEVGSALLLCEKKFIKEIVFHEVIHTCPGAMNHGDKWKKYVYLANEAFGYNIKSRTSYEYLGIEDMAPLGKYLVVCNSCGKKIKRERRSKLVKQPNFYRCSCGGKLYVKEV